MSEFDSYDDLKTESEQDISLDDILAEYQAEQVFEEESAQADSRSSSFLDAEAGEDDDIRVYTPQTELNDQTKDKEFDAPPSHISAIADEARRYISQLQEREYQTELKGEYTSDQSSAWDGDYEATSQNDDESDEDFPNNAPPEIDSRFNLSGRYNQRNMSYGSKEVDLSADEQYVPTAQKGGSIYHWTPEIDEEAPEDDEEEGKYRKKNKKNKKAKKEKKNDKSKKGANPDRAGKEEPSDYFDEAFAFYDSEAEPADYARQDNYQGDSAEPKRFSNDYEPGYFPPSFREYLASLVASIFLRIRGNVTGDAVGTMADSEEDLGPEQTPANACKYYGSYVKSQRLRLRIALVLELILAYISLSLPLPGMLQHIPVTAAACCALELGIMLLCLDVFTTGIMNVFRLKIGADSLAVLSCLFTLADGLIVALSDSAARHIPLCVLSALSVLGVMFASSLNTRALRKATRVPAIGRHFYSVTGEIKLKGKQLTLLKSMRSASGFVRRAEEAPPDETLFIKLGPILILLSLLLSVILSTVLKNYSDFVYILSAVFAPAVPVFSLCAFALPYYLGSLRIFKNGAAIAGWSGLCDIGLSRNLIVTDRDLFPEGSISLDGIRIFADESAETVIAYAGTLICASGSCATGCYSKLMEENGCAMKQVEAFEYLPGGGIRGIIDGRNVLCGSTDLMRLMNVRIPFRLTDKTSVLLAIDGVLYGIFTMKYTPQPQVRKALVELVRSSRHPIFAIRDFNINPEMLHKTFDLATDGYDFPPYVERFDLSEPSQGKDGKIAAIICSEGLGPLTNVADMGRSMYLSTRLNLLFTALSAFLGVFVVFIKLLTAGSVSAGYLLLFMAAWVVPALIVSFFITLKS